MQYKEIDFQYKIYFEAQKYLSSLQIPNNPSRVQVGKNELVSFSP